MKRGHLLTELEKYKTRILELESLEVEYCKVVSELKESEETFRALAETSPSAIFVYRDKFLYVNPASISLTCYTKEELLRMKFWDLVHHDFQDMVKGRGLARQRGEKVPSHYEFKIVRKDGKYRWLDFAGAVIKYRGKPAGLGIVYDITERKEAEIELKESEEKYKTLVDASPDAVTMTDLQGRLTYISEQTLKMHGYANTDELLGRSALILISREDHQRAIDNMNKTLAEGSIKGIEYILLRKDGSSFIGELNASLIKNTHGRPKAYMATTRDVTEHRKAEELIRKSEERYRKLLESVTGYTFTVKIQDGRPVSTEHSVNCQAVTGYTAEEYKENNLLWLEMVCEEDKEIVKDQVNFLLSGYKANLPPIEHRITHKDGTIRWVKNTVVPRYDEQGKMISYDGLVSDITERKLAEIKINQLNEELQRHVVQLENANRELEAFSYSVSHGLRTPLTSISGYSNMLLKRHSALISGECNQYIVVIKNNAQKMEKLIDDLLTRSYLGWKPIKETEINVNELVNEILEELKPMTSDRNVRFNVRELPTAFADRAMLHQVFTNYLANAVKYTSTRENAVIDIDGWSDLRENIYYVRDNGIGFEIKDAENIFGIFQRLHQQPEFKGTGVGLSIVQRIIQRHGGRVWAEGEPGRGSAFYFSLPIKEAGPDREVRPEGG
jgi:PAS domain S-box-containing protein